MGNAVKWLLRLDVIPRGWLTVVAGFAGLVNGIACLAGLQVPGVACPVDPWLLITGGLAAIGLGRRGTQ